MIEMKFKIRNSKRKGAALLIVLFIVMAVTILSLGFLSRSDTELACGENMIIRAKMDYLAESGLQHAKGLILNPQEVSGEYWMGQSGQQLIVGSDDYYDVNVIKLGECNYQITSEAYRQRSGERIARSSLEAELRLDPCIVFWIANDTIISGSAVIRGDVYCVRKLLNKGYIDGDVFTGGSITNNGTITGRENESIAQATVEWPRVTVGDFTSYYPVQTIDTNSISSTTFGPYDPVRVCYYEGDLELAGDVHIESMLIVNGDLTIRFDPNVSEENIIIAQKNLPALLVTDDIIIENSGKLSVDGLVVADKNIQVGVGSTVNISGGLFVGNNIDIDTNSNVTISAAPSKTAITVWSAGGAKQRWGQAAGAFFRSIERN